MTQIRAYTTIEQSKKLAEILPLATADMDYIPVVNTDNIDGEYSVIVNTWDNDHIIDEGWIPCWSLSTLLSVLPISIDEGQHCLALINSNPNDIEWLCCYEDYKGDLMMECYAGNPVDACVDMIIKLKELNLL